MAKLRKEKFEQDTLIFFLSDNGGLLTFRLPGENINVGLAFDVLETNRDELGVSDYTVAQPTLEQVFVRTVYELSLIHISEPTRPY